MSEDINIEVWNEIVAKAKSGTSLHWDSHDKAIIYAEQQLLETQLRLEHKSTLLESCEIALQERDEQLLEANARIARLEWCIKDLDLSISTVDEDARRLSNSVDKADDILAESPAKSLALHDADVIEKARETAIRGKFNSWSKAYILLGQYADTLRNSVNKGGEAK